MNNCKRKCKLHPEVCRRLGLKVNAWNKPEVLDVEHDIGKEDQYGCLATQLLCNSHPVIVTTLLIIFDIKTLAI